MRQFANGWLVAALLSAAGCSEAAHDVDLPRAQDEVAVDPGKEVLVQPASNKPGEPQKPGGAEPSGVHGGDASAAARRVFDTRLQSSLLARGADGDALSLNDLGKFLEELCKQTLPGLHEAGGAGATDAAPEPLTPEQVHKVLEDLFAFFTAAFPPADNSPNASADAPLTPAQLDQILTGLFEAVAKAFPPPDSRAPEIKPEDVLKFLDDLFNLFFPKPSDGTVSVPTPPDATPDDAGKAKPGDPSISVERTPSDSGEEPEAAPTAPATPDASTPESAPDAVRAD